MRSISRPRPQVRVHLELRLCHARWRHHTLFVVDLVAHAGDVVGEIAGVDPSGADKVQVWTRAIELKAGMAALAVAVVNFANSTRTVKVPLSMVDARWGNTTTVFVDDLWEPTDEEALPKETGSLTVTIYPHDTKVLQLTLG